MAELTITKTRFLAGTWEGIIHGATGDAPLIDVSHLGIALDDVVVTPDQAKSDQWNMRVSVPGNLLADGVQVFLISDQTSGKTLNSFTIITGEPLEDDIRADVELLRAELDMLKRAFRRHCLENH